MKKTSSAFRFFQVSSLSVGLLALPGFTPHASAFTLLGPYTDWMQTTNGFQQPDDIGGPMNVGEEYRWNVPVIVYAFDASFLDYFGSNGIAAVEAAIGVLNALPPVSQLNPADYPAYTAQTNAAAQSLGLVDLKAMTLALLLEQLGLGQPTRSAYCLREVVFENGQPQGNVIQRNFDPVNFTATPWVNDTAYDYALALQPFGADAVEVVTNSPAPAFPAVADRHLPPGVTYSGLTRDDVGGLRYLLRTNNLNLEILPAGVHGAGTNAGNFANFALRQGVDKITFVRRDFDSLLAQFFDPPYTNTFTDRYVSNNAVQAQLLERVVIYPDLLFTARAPEGNGPQVTLYSRTSTTNWLNSALFGGLPGTAGPGIIQPGVQIAFHKFTPAVISRDETAPGSAHVPAYGWGLFSAGNNQPASFPVGSGQTNNALTVNFHLHAGNTPAGSGFTWNLPVNFGAGAALEMSTNLVDWTRVGTVRNVGREIDWDHTRSEGQKFYRVVPE